MQVNNIGSTIDTYVHFIHIETPQTNIYSLGGNLQSDIGL